MAGSSARRELSPIADLVDDVASCLEAGKAIRRDVGKDGRLHIDRPLPFLCLHLTGVRKISPRAISPPPMPPISSLQIFRRRHH